MKKDPDQVFERYQDLQAYVDWSDEDARRVQELGPYLQPYLDGLIEDFYAEIVRHPEAHKVFSGGTEQIDRLKVALRRWLDDLFAGPYDREYVSRRWRVGARHVEIGLDQAYTNAALSRLRDGLVRLVGELWSGDRLSLVAAIRSLDKILDLDLAKIQDAYQAEYVARLQASDRLSTLGQIAGSVAHELRNPLNVVKTSFYYLNTALNATAEKRAEHLRRIERSIARAEDVISTLTSFARMPAPEMMAFSAENCVTEALEDTIVPGGVEVQFLFDSDLPLALADRSQIRIVLENLIRNAVEAMPSGGRLTIRGRRHADQFVLDVVDTGIGIAPEDIGRIMEPLFSTKTRGMGLGLAISKMIVTRNEGSLEVESEQGQGSTFTVRLALADPRSA